MFTVFSQAETAKIALKFCGLLFLRQVLRSDMEQLFDLTQSPTDATGENGTDSITICNNINNIKMLRNVSRVVFVKTMNFVLNSLVYSYLFISFFILFIYSYFVRNKQHSLCEYSKRHDRTNSIWRRFNKFHHWHDGSIWGDLSCCPLWQFLRFGCGFKEIF